MINFITFNKNSDIFNELFNKFKLIKDKKIILMVPEQFLFCAEQKIVNFFNKTKIEVEVLHFSQLAYNIIKKFQNIKKITAQKADKLIILNQTLLQIKKFIPTYSFLIYKLDFLKLLLKQIEFFKSNQDQLKSTTNEFLLIYRKYNSNLKLTFNDSVNILKLANKICSKNLVFDKYELFFIEYNYFNQSEIELLITISKQTSLNLFFYYVENCKFFNITDQTILKISKIAQNEKIDINNIKTLAKKNKTMFELNKFLINEPITQLSHNEISKNLKVFKAKTTIDEVRWIILEIIKLIKKNEQFKSIEILVSNLDKYESILISELKQNNIPFFLNKPVKFKSLTLIKCCCLLLKLANSKLNFCQNCVLILKTNLTKFNILETAIFENYINFWNINYNNFTDEFNFENCSCVKCSNLSDNDKLNFKIAQNIQKTLIKALNIIKSSQNNSKSIAINLIKALEILEIGEKFKNNKTKYENFIFEWNSLISALETIFNSTKNKTINLKLFEFLFKLTVENLKSQKNKLTLNCVNVGSLNRTIPYSPKFTFILGNLEFKLTNFINNKANLIDKISLNNLKIYRAICSSSCKLFLSFINEPCDLIKLIVKKFKVKILNSNNSNLFIENCVTDKIMLHQFFLNKYEFKNKFILLFLKNRHKLNFINKIKLDENFSNLIIVSPSQIEKFYLCPFSYFLRYILKLNSIANLNFKPDNKILGLVLHFILENTISINNFNNLNLTQLNSMIENFLNLSINNQFNHSLTNKIIWKLNNYKKILVNLSEQIQLELRQSNFKSYKFEINLNELTQFKNLKIDIDKNYSVLVNGKIDRLDIKQNEQQTHIRIVDYKTYDRNLNYFDFFNGQNLQLLIYALILEKSKIKAATTSLLWVNIFGDYLIYNTKTKTEEDELIKLKNSFFKNGLILNNLETQTLEPYNLIPLQITKNKQIKKHDLENKIMSLNEKNMLFQFVEKKIKDMVKKCNSFQFDRIEQNSCIFCEYFEICNLNLNKLNKNSAILNKSNFFNMIKKNNMFN